jgi:GNAT superfamily N-acetyltransferase
MTKATYTVRQSQGAGDLAAMVSLRTQAEVWLREQGIRQWTPDYDAYARDVLAATVAAGTAWVVDDAAGNIIATIHADGPDLDFWTADDEPDQALYVGKMIVSRSHTGQDLGGALLDWASRRAQRLGHRWLRLDCRRDNERLHEYYRLHGFTHVRTVVPQQRRTESGALFQRPAGTVTVRSIEIDEKRPAISRDQEGSQA